MEIEKKYLINLELSELSKYTNDKIVQGYISTDPVIRIRQKNKSFYITYKSEGLMIRNEFEDEISHKQYESLKPKINHNLISKKRYYVPISDTLTAEVDVFENQLEGLVMAEVEFASEEDANNFIAPNWFIKEVTYDPMFQNSNLCKQNNINFLKMR
jgi:CYTH domain-containing protein